MRHRHNRRPLKLLPHNTLHQPISHHIDITRHLIQYHNLALAQDSAREAEQLLLTLREGRDVEGGVEPAFGGDEGPQAGFGESGGYFGGGVWGGWGGVESDATF
jgi:hypothetical protein